MSNNSNNWPPRNDGSFQQPNSNPPPPPDDQNWNGNNSWSQLQSQQQNINDINQMMSNVQIGQQSEGGWTNQQDTKDPSTRFNWNNKTSQELSSSTPSWGPNTVSQKGWEPQPFQQVPVGEDNGTGAWGSAKQQAQKWYHSDSQQNPQISTSQNSPENTSVATSNSDSQNKLTAFIAPNNQNITEKTNTPAAPTQTTNSDDLKPTPQQAKKAPKEKLDPVVRLVNMHEGWGNTPVNQQTKWDTSQSCIVRSVSQNSAAYPPNPNGTDGWGRSSDQPPNSQWNDSRRMSNNWQNTHGNSSNNHSHGGYGGNQQWGNDHSSSNGSNQWNSGNPGLNNRSGGPPAGMHGGARSGYNLMNNRGYGDSMGSQWSNKNTDNYKNNMRSRPTDIIEISHWEPDYNANQKLGGGQMNRDMGFSSYNSNKWDSQSQMRGLNQFEQGGNDWNDNNNWNQSRQQDLWNNKSVHDPNNWNGQNNLHNNSTWGSYNQQNYGGPGNRNTSEYG